MAGRTREERIAALEQKLDKLKNYRIRPRLQVAVSPLVKEMLSPIFQGKKGAAIIVKEAESMTLLRALKLLAAEEEMVRNAPPEWRVGGPHTKTQDGSRKPTTVIVTPSAVLMERAARWYISPHVLVRAAAVKIARNLHWYSKRNDGRYLAELERSVSQAQVAQANSGDTAHEPEPEQEYDPGDF